MMRVICARTKGGVYNASFKCLSSINHNSNSSIDGIYCNKRAISSSSSNIINRKFSGSSNHEYEPASTHVNAFEKLIGKENVLTEDITKYTMDWTR